MAPADHTPPTRHIHIHHEKCAPGECSPNNVVEDCVATLAISALRMIQKEKLRQMHSVASLGGLVFKMHLSVELAAEKKGGNG